MATHLGLHDPREAAQRIVAGTTLPLDVARVVMGAQTIYSVNIVGWGSVVDITQTAERLRWVGLPRYTLAALWHILRARRHPARVTLDAQTIDDQFLFAAGCNTKFTGKGMKLAPRAETHDGKLDVILVRHASRRHGICITGPATLWSAILCRIIPTTRCSTNVLDKVF